MSKFNSNKCNAVILTKILERVQREYKGKVIGSSQLSRILPQCTSKGHVPVERDGQKFMVCKTHDKDTACFVKEDSPTQLSMPTLQGIEAHLTVTGDLESGAMQNPENTRQGISKVKAVINNKKEKDMSSNTDVEAVLKGTIFECNVPKAQTVKGKVTLFVTKRYQNMETTLTKLEERAQVRLSSLSGTQRLKKAFVMEVNGEAVVIKTVVKEGKLVMETITGVPFETMNLLRSKY